MFFAEGGASFRSVFGMSLVDVGGVVGAFFGWVFGWEKALWEKSKG